MFKVMGTALAAGLVLATQAFAADAPSEIKIGTLYASSGRFASISMPVHSALKLWADQKNAEGGVYVKAFDKKIPSSSSPMTTRATPRPPPRSTISSSRRTRSTSWSPIPARC